MAGNDFGGIIKVRLSGGALISLRGTFNINPAALSAEPITNSDGTLDRTFTPVNPRVEMTFKRGDSNPADMIAAPRQNITVIEETNGRQHLFTNAFFTGDPQENRMTGEVSGMGFSAETYKVI